MGLFGLFGKKKKELTPEEMYDKGMELYRAGQYDEAYPLLKKTCTLPKEGEPEPNVDGVVALAWLMENGKGCRQDQDEALRYFQWAAERGDPQAMDGVIELVIHQEWTPKDLCQQALEYAEARAKMLDTEEARNRAAILHIRMNNIIDLEIDEKVAENGSALNQIRLGYRYYEGTDAPKNMEKAFYWFLKAAKQGDADAQANCGVMYYLGKGTKENRASAYYWFRKAAAQGNGLAVENCGIIEGNGEDCVHYVKELEGYEQAAAQGDVKAMKECAEWFGDGLHDMEKDYVKALYWYEKFTELGDSWAFYKCGRIYYWGGHGIDADKAKALACYKRSAELGEKYAQCEYGLMLVKGEATAVDREAGRGWIEKAAAQGYRHAQRKLEELFGVPKK